MNNHTGREKKTVFRQTIIQQNIINYYYIWMWQEQKSHEMRLFDTNSFDFFIWTALKTIFITHTQAWKLIHYWQIIHGNQFWWNVFFSFFQRILFLSFSFRLLELCDVLYHWFWMTIHCVRRYINKSIVLNHVRFFLLIFFFSNRKTNNINVYKLRSHLQIRFI